LIVPERSRQRSARASSLWFVNDDKTLVTTESKAQAHGPPGARLPCGESTIDV